jgi:hypothetical protein
MHRRFIAKKIVRERERWGKIEIGIGKNIVFVGVFYLMNSSQFSSSSFFLVEMKIYKCENYSIIIKRNKFLAISINTMR